jgi:hypothetical protein
MIRRSVFARIAGFAAVFGLGAASRGDHTTRTTSHTESLTIDVVTAVSVVDGQLVVTTQKLTIQGGTVIGPS